MVNSSQSFLRGCSLVIILNLAQIKISISFLDGLANFSSTGGQKGGGYISLKEDKQQVLVTDCMGETLRESLAWRTG